MKMVKLTMPLSYKRFWILSQRSLPGLANSSFSSNWTHEEAEELIAYNQLMDYIQQDPSQVHSGDELFKFRAITAHQGSLQQDDPH